MVVPYPPGIPLIMPGERITAATKSIHDYLLYAREFDRKFPGFETDIHGLRFEPTPKEGAIWWTASRRASDDPARREIPDRQSRSTNCSRSLQSSTPRRSDQTAFASMRRIPDRSQDNYERVPSADTGAFERLAIARSSGFGFEVQGVFQERVGRSHQVSHLRSSRMSGSGISRRAADATAEEDEPDAADVHRRCQHDGFGHHHAADEYGKGRCDLPAVMDCDGAGLDGDRLRICASRPLQSTPWRYVGLR